MPHKIKAKDVQRARAEWYSFHYENRQRVKALTEAEQRTLQFLCADVTPTMTVFGGAQFDLLSPRTYAEAARYKIDPILINPWYVSDMGWNSFLDLWRQLPEPVNLYTPPCVQIGELYTVSTADEIERP